MLKFNNKVLKILDKWLNPNGAPVPPSGQWYTLFEGEYGDFTTYAHSNYIKAIPYIETNTSSASKVSGYISLFKSVSIPAERQNDDYLLLEFPFFPWRASKVASRVLDQDDSWFHLNISNQTNLETFMFDLKSLPLSSIREDIDYGVLNWRTTLSIPNISYTETFDHIQPAVTPQEPVEVYLRVLVNSHTGRIYFNYWRKDDLPEQIRVSDFIDTQLTVNITDKCVINLNAQGYGKYGTTSNPNDYLISGYAADHPNIKLKSYKGTL